MAVTLSYMRILVSAITYLRKSVGDRKIKAVSLGYPDILLSRDDLAAFIPFDWDLEEHPMQEKIRTYHGRLESLSTIYDAQSVFEYFSIELDVIDVAELRGGEIVVDLNSDAKDIMNQKYDLLIDTGTLEHCFNVGQAIQNVCGFVSVGGVAVHAVPMNVYNHGFWNFSPTVFPDLYEANGWRILSLVGHQMYGKGNALFGVPHFARFNSAPDGTILVCVAQKMSDQPFVWPVQRKYQKMLTK